MFAADFVRFSMDEGYAQTLSIAPEGKFPVRRGVPGDPDKFLVAWSKLPVGVDRKAPLADLYPPETNHAYRLGAGRGEPLGRARGAALACL